jgi:hypothetical protein
VALDRSGKPLRHPKAQSLALSKIKTAKLLKKQNRYRYPGLKLPRYSKAEQFGPGSSEWPLCTGCACQERLGLAFARWGGAAVYRCDKVTSERRL